MRIYVQNYIQNVIPAAKKKTLSLSLFKYHETLMHTRPYKTFYTTRKTTNKVTHDIFSNYRSIAPLVCTL